VRSGFKSSRMGTWGRAAETESSLVDMQLRTAKLENGSRREGTDWK
jgi:hypothetical protein